MISRCLLSCLTFATIYACDSTLRVLGSWYLPLCNCRTDGREVQGCRDEPSG